MLSMTPSKAAKVQKRLTSQKHYPVTLEELSSSHFQILDMPVVRGNQRYVPYIKVYSCRLAEIS